MENEIAACMRKKYYRLHLIRIKSVLHDGKGDFVLHRKFFIMDKTNLFVKRLMNAQCKLNGGNTHFTKQKK